jgi:hypothetical protein
MPLLAFSVFNKNRMAYTGTMEYNQLNLSEALLNEALANITIAALSLNNWFGLVNGSTSSVFNTYKFEHKFSFYLPYALSLLFTLPVIVVGLLAFHHNGVAAIDGGFLQILLTTTGDTELRKLAAKGSLGGKENIPAELKKLKVRFGSLGDTGETHDQWTTEAHGMAEAEENFEATKNTSYQQRDDKRMRNTTSQRVGFGTLEETKPLLKVG